MPNLTKAKAKALVAHFKKAAAFHEHMADQHEKCMMAQKAHGEQHEGLMGKAEDSGHSYHKSSAAYHKAMAGHHEKMHKSHKTHADHAADMSASQTEDDTAAKAALTKMQIEIEDDAAANPADRAATVTTTQDQKPGDATMSNTDEAVKAAVAAELAKKAASDAASKTPEQRAADDAAEAVKKAAAAALASAVANPGDGTEINLDKALDTGLKAAVKEGLDKILQSDEFSKIVQERIAAMMLQKLGTSAPAKTFAIPRAQENILQVTSEQISAGATPQVPSAKSVDPAFADLVSMGN